MSARGPTYAEQAAFDDAKKLARSLGHAAVVAVRGLRPRARFAAFDSWNGLDRGWRVVAFVSVTGHVARTEASAP